jgi:hypothetical protein
MIHGQKVLAMKDASTVVRPHFAVPVADHVLGSEPIRKDGSLIRAQS